MQEEVYDAGGPDWPQIDEDSRARVEAKITQAPDQPENVMTGFRKVPRAKGKVARGKGKPKGDLTASLNALVVEIEDAMDLIRLISPDVPIEPRYQRINILCTKMSKHLLNMQDIRDRIAAAVGED